MQLPIELKRVIEKNKAQYGIEGEDEEILKRIIPMLEDEDIIRIYDDLCYEDDINIYNRGLRPDFQKYREEILGYLDENMVKAEIIRREQNQSSKLDLQQRNYTYISEFTTILENKEDKQKIIKSFYRKIKQLDDKRNLLNVKETLKNIDLTIHIYQCILHVVEKMDIDLGLYRGRKYNKKFKLLTQTEIKKLKRKKQSKEYNEMHLRNIFMNENIKKINKLKLEKQKLKENIRGARER